MVNFDEVQHENEELKAKNQELNQKIEELQNEIESLRGQVQYYQNFISSMGAVSDPPLESFFIWYRKKSNYNYRHALQIIHR